MNREFNMKNIIWSHCCFGQVLTYVSQVNFNFEHGEKILFKNLMGYEGSNGTMFSTASVQLFVCFCLSETSQAIPTAFFTVLNITLHVAIKKESVLCTQ